MSLMSDTADVPVSEDPRERGLRLGELIRKGARAMQAQGDNAEALEMLAIAYYECLVGD